MEVAQKFLQNFMPSSSIKTHRLENDQKTSFDDDNEENVGNSSNSVEKSANSSTSTDLKGRLKISLNNARYGLTTKGKTNFNDKSPICLLGILYRGNYTKAINENNNTFNNFKLKLANKTAKDDFCGVNFTAERNELLRSYEKFLDDFKSIIWFTYRTGFRPLPGTKLESDCGWGCMLRCGQMLIAEGLMRHLSKNKDTPSNVSKDALRRRVINDFLDCPEAPLSLHKLVEIGLKQNKQAGDWYGPVSTSFIFKDALESAGLGPTFRNSSFQNLAVYVAVDCVVCTDDVERLCGGGRDSEDGRGEWKKSLLLVIPLRLGAETTNCLYLQHFKCLFSLSYFIGVIGGKPKRSVYFVGWHDDNLIYLDPHYCQDVIDHNCPAFSLQSFSCSDPRKMSFSSMDPSCAVGFYLHNKTEFVHFLADISEIVEFGGPSTTKTKYPLFSVVHARHELPERKISVESIQETIRSRSRSNSASNVFKPRLNSIGSTKGYVLL